MIVTWALGHLLGLKMPEDYKQDWAAWKLETLPMVPKKFDIKPLPKTGHQLRAIKQLSQRNDVSEAVIATDAGREGELVARWILEYVKFKKPVKRLWISSQTDKAIKEGFRQLKPSKQYDALYQSALARAEADWLVGLNVTRALTVKYQDSLSAGRVQTPTLAFVREQEKQIETFKPQTYYVIDFETEKQKGRLQMKNPQALKERTDAEKLVERLHMHKQKVVVDKVQRKKRVEAAPLPYDLTEIQREANQRYQFSAKKTLSLVQSLYEIHKVVTYPRTDSKYLTTDMKQTMKERLQAVVGCYPEVVKRIMKQGAQVKQTKVFQNEKVSDHHGLIPTEQTPRFEKLDADEQKIYLMIVQRFIGLFEEPLIVSQETITAQVGEESIVFKQNVTEQLGWKNLNQGKEEAAVEPWHVKEGEVLKGYYSIQKEITSPPSALTESSLLGKMEKFNLGTPATRAEIIEKLLKSELMERNNGKLAVTPKGKQLLQLVNPSLVTPQLTSTWEQKLEAIAQGKEDAHRFIKQIEKDTQQLVSEIKRSEKKYQDFSITQKKCPECGSPLKEKNGRDGKIYLCTNAECTYRRRKEPKMSNHRCPQCHRKMEIHEGKSGAYFKCKYCTITEKIPDKKQKNKKLTKHEERQLLKKYSKPEPKSEEDNPFAQALKAAMKKD